MSSPEPGRRPDGPGELANVRGFKISPPSSGLAQCEKNTAAKPNEPSMTHTSKIHQHDLAQHSQPPQQQQLLHQLNRHECGSNQSGSDSGLGHTNSISSENSSLMAHTTSLEQITIQNNGKPVDRREIGVSRFVVDKNDGQKQAITRSDSFDEKAQKSAQSNEGNASSRIENGKIDAAITSVPATAKAVRDDDRDNDSHRNEAQRNLYGNERQLAESVKVSESIGNNVRANHDNNGALLSAASLPATRTKDGPSSIRETLSARESSTNGAKVINNIDDEAKIKHSAKCGANHTNLVNSTMRPREADNESLDSSANHEVQSGATLLSNAHERPIQRINPIVSSSPNSTGTLPLIKSLLKKTGANSADGLKRPTKHNRNVSFNQTVIVFCEEIETSSSETFEPPLDYQDSFAEPQMLSNHKDASLRDVRSQTARANDDFDILSKIVCDDASSLTDDQLIGLLEKGSLLKKFDLDENDKALAIDQLNSDQGYLCHDAISDSDSESSLATDIRLCETGRVVDKPAQPPIKAKNPSPADSKRSANPQVSSGNDQSDNSLERHSSQTAKAHFESHAEASSIVQQNRSVPARVKVSTVDDYLRRPHKLSTAQVDENDSASNCACPTLNQGNKQVASKSELVLVRLTNEPMMVSKAQANENLENTVERHTKFEHGKDCSQNAVIKIDNSLSFHDQISSRESQLDTTTNQNKASNPPSQPVNVVNAKIIQTNQACHICRAIESNINQTKLGPRREQTSLMTNISSSTQNFDCAPEQPLPSSQLQRSASIHGQGHGPISAMIEPQQPKQTQLLATVHSSCVSCREISARQRPKLQTPVTQLVLPKSTINPLDHQQQVKPIACQLIYVVDQNGNRMRALQVVNPAQMGLNHNQARPSAIGHNNCRQPVPSAGQNLYCAPSQMSRPSIGPVCNALNQTNSISAQPMTSQYVPTRDMPNQAINQRIELVNHSAPKNHILYYVRQPLSHQNLQQASNMPNSVARTFPDVHEIRRLDGIRGPTESPSLVHTMNHPNSSTQAFGGSEAVPQSKIVDQISRFRRDDSEDPSFGFSSRPAVKVVAKTAANS